LSEITGPGKIQNNQLNDILWLIWLLFLLFKECNRTNLPEAFEVFNSSLSPSFFIPMSSLGEE
jgi:hypothetical protein